MNEGPRAALIPTPPAGSEKSGRRAGSYPPEGRTSMNRRGHGTSDPVETNSEEARDA